MVHPILQMQFAIINENELLYRMSHSNACIDTIFLSCKKTSMSLSIFHFLMYHQFLFTQKGCILIYSEKNWQTCWFVSDNPEKKGNTEIRLQVMWRSNKNKQYCKNI